MPVFSHEYLHKVAVHIYLAEGVSDDEAEVVATHQVKANLVGHDSHGVSISPNTWSASTEGISCLAPLLRWSESRPPARALTAIGDSGSS